MKHKLLLLAPAFMLVAVTAVGQAKLVEKVTKKGNELVIPYGLSDYATGFATVPLEPLLDKIISEENG